MSRMNKFIVPLINRTAAIKTKHDNLVLILSVAIVFTSCSSQPDDVTSDQPVAPDKPRVIVTTDGEIDDACSMVRFLLYANKFEVEVTGGGTPQLTRYQRVIVKVETE